MIDDFVEQHRFLGPAVARIIADHVAGLASRRVTPEATPAELEKLFDEPLPEKGIALEEIFKRFRNDVAPNAMGVPSPRYFGQFNPTPLPIGVWADALASMLNQNAGAWRNGPTSAMIEARVIRWLCDLLELWSTEFRHARERRLGSEFDRLEVCARQCRHEHQGSRRAHGAWRSGDLRLRTMSLFDRQERRHSRSWPRRLAKDSHRRPLPYNSRRTSRSNREGS